jgi:hypothetical protein
MGITDSVGSLKKNLEGIAWAETVLSSDQGVAGGLRDFWTKSSMGFSNW